MFAEVLLPGMPYKILEHTADLKMRVTGKTMEKLFQDAARGMMNFLKGKKDKRRTEKTTRTIKTRSRDKTALLVDFLSEVLTLSQINKETYSGIIFKKLTEKEAEAELKGIPVLEFEEDIKAVTYHEADVKKNAQDMWATNIVFDI